MGEIDDTRSNLQSHWNSLQAQWQMAKHSWRDKVGDRFEREFMSFWEEEMPKLLRAMDELNETLDTAMRYTEDP